MKTLSTRKQPSVRWLRLLAGTMLAGSVALAVGMIGCGGGGGGGGAGAAAGSGTITSGISDPAQECAAPTGPYQAIWVTVQDVQANLSSSASSNSSTWQDLTPNLKNAPVQVDLLGDTTDCLLATLGTTSGLKAGKYQQIRIFMVPNGTSLNSAAPSSNACSGAGTNVWNCVEIPGTPPTWYPLTMPSNANTGLKIPPGQIAQGGLTVQNGQGLDLDIDVNACASVVATGGHSGKYMFKPTLRASELGTNPLISGTLYQAAESGGNVTIGTTPVPGAMVWLEQQSAPATVGNATIPVDNLIQTTTSAGNTSPTPGSFEFCPVGSGTYEIVANVDNWPLAGNSSITTITTGVNVTSSGGPNNLEIPLVASGNTSISGTLSASGTVTSTTVEYSATQPFLGNSGRVQAIEPPLAVSAQYPGGTEPPSVTQTPSTYTLTVPDSPPAVGTASSSGAGYTMEGNTPYYRVWGSASSCSPSSLITNQLSAFPASGVDLAFQNCN